MSYRELRADNLHNMMIDPTTVNARVYIGNIPTNEISKRDIEDRFQKYGPILGIALNRGFGFVQFEHESHAAEAIKHENGVMLRGKKMEVNPARVYGGRSRGGGGGGGGGGSSNEPRDLEDRDPFRDRSPIDDRGRERDWRDRDRYDNFSGKGGMDRGNYYGRESSFGKDSGSYSGQDKFRSTPSVSSGRDDRSTFGKDPYSGTGSFRPSGIGNGRGSIPPRDYIPANNVNPLERTNDCEIIVFNKAQRVYAEYIERRLKQLDITVDLLFPNEEVPVSRILANISSRGSLYAISVMPQNEEHRSLTLNILHGLPQEHRNMPLEDAVPLIKRNFEAYRTGEKSAIVAASSVGGGGGGGGSSAGAGGSVPTAVAVAPAGMPAPPTSERHPEAIQVLLSLLADNRQLTVLQYDRVLRYLQDRRELQLKLELGDAKDLAAPASSAKVGRQPTPAAAAADHINSPFHLPSRDEGTGSRRYNSRLFPFLTTEPTTKQQVDLQHRILNILNNQSTSTTSAGVMGSTTAVSAGSMGSMASMVGGLGSSGSMAGLGGLAMSMAGTPGLGPTLNIAPVPAPVAPPSGNWQSQSSSSTPLLSDPTVQKALDSLMQGNLLRKITPTSGSSTSGISSLGAPSQHLFSSTWGTGASKM